MKHEMQSKIQSGTVRIERVEAIVRRAAITTPVRTSFGVMRDRPAVFVKVTDADGVPGLGEVWCNFPSVGAEHRQRLAEEIVGPLLTGYGEIPLATVFASLMDRLHILAIQSGEWGPLRQVAAGLDAACHDLAARRAGLPLWRFLNPAADGTLRAYASGIGPEAPADMARAAAAQGHNAFKLKVGFGRDTDLRSLASIRATIGRDATLLIDVNQGWSEHEAIERASEYATYDLGWIEEPLRADEPLSAWRRVAARAPVPLAAGENIDTMAAFKSTMDSGAIRFVQPDVAKWGGVSGCSQVAQRAAAKGLVYCPHYLGGGVGLLASAHLLAAAGGDGMLEVDVNPNPLRDDVAADCLRVVDGAVRLCDRPGIGIEAAGLGL